MSPETRIRTERLLLRSWRVSDVDAYDNACNTPEVMRWLGGVQKRAAVRREAQYFIKAEARDGFTFWVLERDRELLGFCGLLRIREPDCPFAGSVEIGWRIRRTDWRHGYGFEAASAVLQLAFARLQLPKIVSRASPKNLASRRLMLKLGLRRTRGLDYVPFGERDKLVGYAISLRQWKIDTGHL